MKVIRALVVFSFLGVAVLWAAKENAPAFSAESYIGHVKYLASEPLGGRGTGTPGLEKAARYIEKQFRAYGLKPIPGQKSYRQELTVTVSAKMGPKNAMKVNGRELKADKDYLPVSFSLSGTAEGALVFAGYGITAKEYSYDDYEGLDVKDKFVVVLRHEPQELEEKSVFAGKNFTSHAQFAMKASNAKARGARGVIIVNDTPVHPKDEDRPDRFGSVSGPGNSGIYLAQVNGAEAESWFQAAGKSLKEVIEGIDHDLKPRSFAFPETLKAQLTVEIRQENKPVHNLAAYLPGETDEYVIIGAHYDHLGMGGARSLAPSEHKVHPGADDNASGAAGLLEAARYFAARGKQKRGILFLAFTAEEIGLLGSQYYATHPALPLNGAVAMINMDMIGRIRDSKVFMTGVGTGSTFQKMVDEAAPKHGITLDLSEKAGYGSSDHSSFTAKQVPILFFFSGLHGDYHKPSDTWDKIDGAAAAKLLGLVADLATRLAGDDGRPQYVKVAETPVTGVGGGGRGYGAYFGSIPDFAEIPNGVKFAGVREGSPADKAGLKGGDILIEFDGVAIGNLYDFTRVLQTKKPGEEVLVKVVRDGRTIEAKVLLTQRK